MCVPVHELMCAFMHLCVCICLSTYHITYVKERTTLGVSFTSALLQAVSLVHCTHQVPWSSLCAVVLPPPAPPTGARVILSRRWDVDLRWSLENTGTLAFVGLFLMRRDI